MALTPIFALGWETNSILEGNAASDSTLPTISSTKAKTGTYSLRNQNSASLASYGRTVDSLTEMQAAASFNHSGSSAGTPVLFRLVAADATPFVVRLEQASGLLQLRIGSTTHDTLAFAASGLSTTDVWHDCSVALKIATSGGYFDFYGPDGTKLLEYSGNTGTSPVTAVMFGGSAVWTNYLYIDDCRCLDASGEGSKAASTRRFLWAAAAGNGASSQWTGSDGNSVDNYLLVDDTTPDGDTTYVKALSATLVDQYTHAGVTVPAEWVPVRVWPTIIGLKTDAGIATTVKTGLAKGASVSDSAELTLSTSYGMVQAAFAALPDASALTQANINLTEIKVTSAGVYS